MIPELGYNLSIERANAFSVGTLKNKKNKTALAETETALKHYSKVVNETFHLRSRGETSHKTGRENCPNGSFHAMQYGVHGSPDEWIDGWEPGGVERIQRQMHARKSTLSSLFSGAAAAAAACLSARAKEKSEQENTLSNCKVLTTFSPGNIIVIVIDRGSHFIKVYSGIRCRGRCTVRDL